MFRVLQILICLWFVGMNQAVAQDDSGELEPPRSAFGGGVGFMGLLHIDYHRWVADDMSIEVGLTPLFMLNVASAGATRHINLAPSASNDHNLVVSAVVVGIVGIMDGTPAFGPGVRVGYEWLARRVGISLAGGPVVFVGPRSIGVLAPDVRLTVWGVKR